MLGKIGTREEAKEGRAEAAKGGSKGSWGTCRRGARRREFSCRAACSEVAVRLERKVCHVRVGYWFRSRRCVQGRECKELRWGCVVLGGQRKSGGAKTRGIRRQVLQTGTVVGDLQSTLLPVSTITSIGNSLWTRSNASHVDTIAVSWRCVPSTRRWRRFTTLL